MGTLRADTRSRAIGQLLCYLAMPDRPPQLKFHMTRIIHRLLKEKTMSSIKLTKSKIIGIATCVPSIRYNNLRDTEGFSEDEVKKVVGMAGIKERRLADENTCSSDLCVTAAKTLLDELGWDNDSINGLIMVTQTPNYFLPQTSSIIHKELQLNDVCASFDVNLGCSGYPYGL
jgi:3-oxoacyl-[acyl-carrier-protein] synthase-3